MTLRKNASLASVAKAATYRARRRRRRWAELCAAAGEARNWTDRNKFNTLASKEWSAFSELAEIARHLRRLAGLPEDEKLK